MKTALILASFYPVLFLLGYAVGVHREHARTFDDRGFLRQEVADELFQNAFPGAPD